MGTFLHLQLVGGSAHSAFLPSVFLRGLTTPGIAHTLQVTIFPRHRCNSGASKASFFIKAAPNWSSAIPFWLFYPKMETYGLATQHLMLKHFRTQPRNLSISVFQWLSKPLCFRGNKTTSPVLSLTFTIGVGAALYRTEIAELGGSRKPPPAMMVLPRVNALIIASL